MIYNLRNLFIVSFCFLASALSAEVRLPHIFSDNMVIQRDKPIHVWGWANKNASVEIRFAHQSQKVKADKSGNWSVNLHPVPSGGPYELVVKSTANSIILKNILVGDVWLCSGQSNMEMPVHSNLPVYVPVNNYEHEIEAANYPQIRFFTVEKNLSDKPEADLNGTWRTCSPETVADISATAYFFARKLKESLNIPIGLVCSAWGGTDIEAWISPDAFSELPKQVSGRYDDAALLRFKQFKDGDKANKEKVLDEIRNYRGSNDISPNMYSSLLFNAMINPITGFRINGAIWYQGENNAPRAYAYRTLFPAMIDDWREKWGYEFPFYWVQLASFMEKDKSPGGSDWAELREAQTMALSLPQTGQAVITDTGETSNIHPHNKQDVGLRLALIALNKSYGMNDIVCSGPTFKSMEIEGNKVILSFDNIGTGLSTSNKYGYVEGFAIADSSRTFEWAKAYIDGDKVVVYSNKISNPSAVRYSWSNNPDVNLFNKEGLPAAPFRTDNWKGITQYE
jgi:sialate O-acetylesterase